MHKYFDLVENYITLNKHMFYDEGFLTEKDFRNESYKYLNENNFNGKDMIESDVDIIIKRCIKKTTDEALNYLIDEGLVKCSFKDGEIFYYMT